jgi:hypothetical protein
MDAFGEFCQKFPFDSTTKEEQGIAFVWFHLRSKGKEATLKEVRDYFDAAFLPQPNLTRLRNAFAKSKNIHRGSSNDTFRVPRSVSDQFDKQFGYIFTLDSEITIPDKAGINNTPFLSQSEISDAHKMAELYIVLHCYENSARRLIETTLEKNLGKNWWDIASNVQMKQTVKTRKEKEQRNRWLTPRGITSELYYLDWGDLVTMIRKYENHFSHHIGNIKFVELRLDEIENLRNIIAHNGVLPSEDDFQRVILSFRDWCKQVSP